MDQSVQFAESMNLVVGSGFAGERLMCGVEPAGTDPGAVGTENVSGKGVADKQDFFLRTGFDVGEDRIEYRISKCAYVDMFEAYGIRSLCKIFCMTDTTSYENLRRHVTFIRHSDLSDGDACHDEIIQRRKSQ